ncbi:uncharacterized protein G2W53_034352 [Senna tora]|uniref:Uncharacterized protein n=1 Tax=Senna tora TaxID=362788 RepID=A0A834T331_9FABA|nr:uncharacterized protein G2W53_034352 [Senna tora]
MDINMKSHTPVKASQGKKKEEDNDPLLNFKEKPFRN